MSENQPINVSNISAFHNDKISRIEVADGYSVAVYEDTNYGGEYRLYRGPRMVDMQTLIDADLNNDISSFTLFKTSRPAVLFKETDSSTNPGFELKLYEHTNEHTELADEYDNKISYVKVDEGYTLEVYQYGGSQHHGNKLTIVGPDTINRHELDAADINDNITAYKLYATEALTTKENDSGSDAGQTMTLDEVRVDKLNNNDNKISNIIVKDGWVLKVYEYPNFAGRSLKLEGPRTVHVAELLADGLNNAISSYKLYRTTPFIARDDEDIDESDWSFTEDLSLIHISEPTRPY